MKRPSASRRGIGSIWAVIVLSVTTIIMAGITAQLLQTRKSQEHRHNEMQTLWLARSGLELAGQRLLIDPTGYETDTVELIPLSHLKIKVSKGDKPDLYVVRSEASYPVNRRDKTVLALTGRFQRTVEKGQARLSRIRD
jgi:hypothetical protein